MRTSVPWRAGICLLALFAFALSAQAGKKPGGTSGTTLSCTVDVVGTVLDEQDTSAYYGDGEYCDYSNSGNPSYTLLTGAGFMGDSLPAYYKSTLYNFAGWSLFSYPASQYVNGDTSSMVQNPLRVTIASNYTTLNLDLNGTSRTIDINFALCGLDYDHNPECPNPVGQGQVSPATPGLLNVFLTSSESGATFMSMGICGPDSYGNLRACPQARIAYGKFWYTYGGQNWRVDWETLRVLRMAYKTWYIIANECDGTDVVSLSKMNGQNTKPVLIGYYKVPLLIKVVAE